MHFSGEKIQIHVHSFAAIEYYETNLRTEHSTSCSSYHMTCISSLLLPCLKLWFPRACFSRERGNLGILQMMNSILHSSWIY